MEPRNLHKLLPGRKWCHPASLHQSFPIPRGKLATSTTLLDGHVMLAEKEEVWLRQGSLRMALEL